MAGEVTVAPVYVTRPWTRWATPDVFPNIAALVVVAASPLPHPAPEPVFYKHPALQIDQFPNVAARAPQVTAIPRMPLYVTAPWKRWPTPDVFPNVSAMAGVAPPPAILRPYPDPTTYKKAPYQPDVVPNLAVQSTETPQMMSPGVDGQTFIRRAPDIDLAPNLAVRGAPPVYMPPPMLDLSAPRKSWAQPDLYPNVVVGITTAVYVPPAPLEVIVRRTLTTVDLYPNLAITAPIAPIPLLVATDPWINKRYPPQVEVFQNQAVYAPTEAVVPPSNQPQAEPVRFRVTAAPDIYPNLAVNAPFVPPPTPPPDAGGSNPGGLGGGGWSGKFDEGGIKRTVEQEWRRIKGEPDTNAPEPASILSPVDPAPLVQALKVAEPQPLMVSPNDDEQALLLLDDRSDLVPFIERLEKFLKGA